MEIFRFPTLQIHSSLSGLRILKTINAPPSGGLGRSMIIISR
ncbi:hypothetical protein LINPERHAP2_LOCUS24586 [Linum perenne]